jgi:hypothetical protein
VDASGNATFNGTLQTGGVTTHVGSVVVKNQANAEIDMTLWAGTSAAQQESFIYKNYAGTTQWYMVNKTTNDWALNSAVGGLDSFKAYQSTNSGDTYINTSNATGAVRINYETGASPTTTIYNGSGAVEASFCGTTCIKFPGLLSSANSMIPQLDTSGYMTNSGVQISKGSGGPGGGCTAPAEYFNTSGTNGGNNNFYICAGGTWLAVK